MIYNAPSGKYRTIGRIGAKLFKLGPPIAGVLQKLSYWSIVERWLALCTQPFIFTYASPREKYRMLRFLRQLFQQSLASFIADRCTLTSAALAYFSFFALPALLVISISLASQLARMSSFQEEGHARNFIVAQVTEVAGADAASQVDAIIKRASTNRYSKWGYVVGTAILLVGASGAIAQLQLSLNEIWKVQPINAGMRQFLLKRLLSMGLVLGTGIVLLVTMIVGTVLTSWSNYLAQVFPESIAARLPYLASNATIFGVSLLLFAGIFKWLPDARIPWREVWIGAAFTSLLFVAGKAVLSLYFANTSMASAYGAAGSLALLLAWSYYSAMIFLLGAELTRNLVQLRKLPIVPIKGAELVTAQR